MEVHGRQPEPLKPGRGRLDADRQPVRERVEEARADLEGLEEVRKAAREAQAARSQEPRGDRIELSSAAVDSTAQDAERQDRVDALRAAYIAGELGTQERLERAAEGLLRG